MYGYELKEKIRNAYRLYGAGKITLEEREEMIEDLKDKDFMEHQVDFSEIDPSLSPSEKFDEVKRICYERCQDGVISEDERETIIKEAKKEIFLLDY